MTLEELLDALLRQVPEARGVVDQHLAQLPGGDEFVLLGLLRRRALELFEADRLDALDRLLALVDRALADGDDELAEAVVTDFISGTPPWDPAMEPFVATWPVQLRAQAAVETARSAGD
jgi:hypothetical protein